MLPRSQSPQRWWIRVSFTAAITWSNCAHDHGLKTLIDGLPAGVTQQQQLTEAVDNLQVSVNEAINNPQTDLNNNVSNLFGEIESVRNISAQNVDGISILDLGVANPPTQADVQAIVDKLNELINGLHR